MVYSTNEIFPQLSSGIALSKGLSAFPSLWDGLVGYWSPELGKQGAQLFDFSNYKRNASFIAGVPATDYIPGKFGYALQLSASPEKYLEMGNIPQLENASKDLSFVWLMKEVNIGNNYNALLTFDADNALSPGVDIYTYSSDSLRIGGIGDGGEHNTSVVLNDGLWHVVAIVLQGTSLSLFKDGQKVWSDTVAHNHVDYTDSHILRFGSKANVGKYPGAIGFVAAYNRALSNAEVILLSAGASPLTSITNVFGKSAISDQTVSVSTLQALATLYSPLVNIPMTVAVTTLEASSSVLAPYYVGSSQVILPATLLLQAALQNPTILISSTVTPNVLVGTSTIFTPTYPGLGAMHNATKIISFNPLIIVTDTNPVKIASIDITDPNNPVSTTYTLTGAANATDIVYDSIFAKIYITCANGILVEMDATDLESYVVYNTGSTSNLTKVDSLPGYQTIFTSTDNTLGEIVVMDDSLKTLFNTDVRWMALTSKILACNINTQNGSILETDVRWSQLAEYLLGMDIRFNSIAFADYTEPISRLDFHVYLDNVELTDVKMDAINIYHTDDEKSRATIVLARQHDNLDITLDGVTSVITAQNALRIEIDGNIEFDGFISQIDADSANESVQVIAFTAEARGNERSTVNLSIPSINEQLNLHHALVHNPTIENPKISADEMNPSFYNGILVDAGWDEIQSVSRWSSFQNTESVAAEVSNGEFIPKQNWTYFWFATAKNFVTGLEWGTLNYIGTSPTALTGDTWEILGLAFKYQRKFDSKRTRLGTGIVYANDFKYVYTKDCKAMYNALKPHGSLTFTGTTLESYADKPSVYAIMEAKMGYMLGSAPYKKVSCKSGRLVVADQWEDKPDGLYVHRDESYDYRAYAQKILALEYQKLGNINGDILPKTSADIEIFIDGYYYYQIALLKRLNIDNTTTLGIYKNLNGFPVSVKSIEISSSTMKVNLRCDNQWSRTELLEIDAAYPQEDEDEYLHPETNVLQFTKFDPRTMGDVE